MLSDEYLGLFKTADRMDLLSNARTLAAQAAAEFNEGLHECEAKFLQAFRIFQKLNKNEDMARTALGLGRVYMHIRGLQNLQKSKNWYDVALENAVNQLTRAEAMGSLALWEHQQLELENVDKSGVVPATLRHRLDKAEELFCKALELMPAASLVSRAVTLRGLATVRAKKGDIEGAERYIREAMAAYANAGEQEKAATALLNLASLMIAAGRLGAALQHTSGALIAISIIPS
jgi:tetratricopeptide (TPR) repeat protein